MKILTDRASLREHLNHIRSEGHSLALVPTMGALHEGHISLVKLAHLHGKRVIVSIFVNPAQFNEKRDFELYPRTLESDAALLERFGVESIFAPSSPEQIYGTGFQTWITNEKLSTQFEGASRPGHFRGVATVVATLFNLVQPKAALFGEKDFQQLRIIEQMVTDLKFPVEIVRAPLVREGSGLALSSRNARLSERGKVTASALSRNLFIARDAWRGGESRAASLIRLVIDGCAQEPGVKIDYVAIIDEENFTEQEFIATPSRILIAAVVEGVRLIDNIALSPIALP